MRTMSNLEYAVIAGELQPLLGKRFDRIFKVSEGYRLKVADAQIIIQPGVRLHLTKYIEEAEPADRFVQKVRAELENSRLLAIRQINDDRILEFEFDRGSLFVEMFAKGNCILVQQGKTVVAMREESWAGREIKRNVEYRPPKPSVEKSFRNALSEKYVITALMKLPLGKQYAQEILARCRIPEKTPGIELTGNQIDCVEKEIGRTLEEVRPFLFIESGKPVDFGLARFSRHSGLEVSEPKTFSEALDQFYWSDREAEVPGVGKLEQRLADQEKRLEELRAEEAEMKEKGDYLYANYDEAEKILMEARSAPMNELEEKLKKNNAKVNRKEKYVELEF